MDELNSPKVMSRLPRPSMSTPSTTRDTASSLLLRVGEAGDTGVTRSVGGENRSGAGSSRSGAAGGNADSFFAKSEAQLKEVAGDEGIGVLSKAGLVVVVMSASSPRVLPLDDVEEVSG